MHALDRALLVISVDPEAGILIAGATTGRQRPPVEAPQQEEPERWTVRPGRRVRGWGA
ncbi:hypothetical protein [Streptomyces pseudovenezuelae]|uniref:Uncharacterized protein n=1 Tax=Streptomyces pseudovenezuelae TaxID=67350 RepID=A0ABZ1XB42_9ACTN|nr:hypothetical protein [Streptomyces pseudovenezuelae]